LEAVDAYLTRGRPALASRGRGTPALFLGSRGTRLTRQAAWQVVQRAATDAELSATISPHTLRHSYATHLLQGGADVRSVQELLGHASVTTTQLYTQVTVDSLREIHAGAHPRAGRGLRLVRRDTDLAARARRPRRRRCSPAVAPGSGRPRDSSTALRRPASPDHDAD